MGNSKIWKRQDDSDHQILNKEKAKNKKKRKEDSSWKVVGLGKSPCAWVRAYLHLHGAGDVQEEKVRERVRVVERERKIKERRRLWWFCALMLCCFFCFCFCFGLWDAVIFKMLRFSDLKKQKKNNNKINIKKLLLLQQVHVFLCILRQQQCCSLLLLLLLLEFLTMTVYKFICTWRKCTKLNWVRCWIPGSTFSQQTPLGFFSWQWVGFARSR